jgi:hypothetical protein
LTEFVEYNDGSFNNWSNFSNETFIINNFDNNYNSKKSIKRIENGNVLIIEEEAENSLEGK